MRSEIKTWFKPLPKGKDRNHTIQFHWNESYTRKSTNGSKFCFLFQAFL
ncbi:hypothetical protein LEP1GSC163_0780 [Leptospira santarosai str. CBC379]|nr:hypothetical protein LEP1GSC163_0780 [Leptospira santarosai str. CBC379]